MSTNADAVSSANCWPEVPRLAPFPQCRPLSWAKMALPGRKAEAVPKEGLVAGAKAVDDRKAEVDPNQPMSRQSSSRNTIVMAMAPLISAN